MPLLRLITRNYNLILVTYMSWQNESYWYNTNRITNSNGVYLQNCSCVSDLVFKYIIASIFNNFVPNVVY